MANFISSQDSDYVTGTESADSIQVTGNHSTVEALGGNDLITVSGGRGVWTGEEDNLIMAGDGNDSVATSSRGVSIYGGDGNDTISFYGSNFKELYSYGEGGDGNDVFTFGGWEGVSKTTVKGGAGNDTLYLTPHFVTDTDLSIVVTDFSNDETIIYEERDYGGTKGTRSLGYVVENGNVVLSDNIVRGSDSGQSFINITLQGVSDISQVASAKFIRKDYGTSTEYKTLGEIFGVSANSTTSSGSSTSTTTPSSTSTETTPAASSTSTTPAATTPSSSGGNTTIININGGTYVNGDNNGTINYGTINNIQGLTVNNNTITVNNEFTQNLQLNQYTQYSNVINIDGSQLTEAKLLSGNSNNNSIQAGSAGSTLYGGGQGNNTLSGGSGRDFFEFTGSGNDIAQNFTAGTGENSDVVYLTGTSLSSIRRDSNYLAINSATGKSLQVSNSESVDEAIQYSTNGTRVSAAKIGRANQSNSFTYEDGVNYYRGGNYTDVLNVTSYESRNIRLNRGTFSGINNIDASTSTGNNTLAGDSSNNQITAGQGNDSLWGGSGSSSDTLIGGSSGSDTFFYGKNDGADVIQNASSSDTVNLYNVRVSDISSARVVGNTIMANFKTGGSLQINGTSSMSSVFKLASGSQWQYNGSRWQRA